MSLIPFAFEGSPVRVINDGGAPWFVARDVVEAVDATWNGTAAIKHVPEQWKGVRSDLTPGGNQQVSVLSERGVFFYLGRSDKPKALPIQMWIAGEVLPSIRETGSYSLQPAPQLTQLEALKQALVGWEAAEAKLAESERNVGRLANRVEEMAPSVAALDLIATSTDAIIPRAAAKTLGLGPLAFNRWLRDNKWTYKANDGDLPYQTKVDSGHLELKYYDRKAEKYYAEKGPNRRPQVIITGKGMRALSKLFSGSQKKSA